MSQFLNSIGVRLLRYVFGFYLFVTLITTSVQLVSQYRHAEEAVIAELVELENVFNQSLMETIWSMDQKQLQAIVKGIMKVDVVTGVIVADHNGKDLSTIGEAARENRSIKVNEGLDGLKKVSYFENTGLKTFSYSFPLNYQLSDRVDHIGTIEFFSSQSVVFDRVKYGFFLLIGNAILKTLALWGIFYFVVLKLVVSPLAKLEREVMRLDPDHEHALKQGDDLEQIIQDNKDNELSRLARSFQHMRESILRKILKIEQHSHDLEKMVFERTKDLEKANKELEKQALYDPLTNLPNRRLLAEHIDHAIHLGRRQMRQFGLVSIDLRKFKNINDTWGHQAGDDYLNEFSNRLSSVLRKSDVLARVGGDEFIILLQDVDEESWEGVLMKFCQSLEKPMVISGYNTPLSANFGIALFPAHGETVKDLLQYADQAMYSAKNSGKEYCIYNPDIDEMYRFCPLPKPVFL